MLKVISFLKMTGKQRTKTLTEILHSSEEDALSACEEIIDLFLSGEFTLNHHLKIFNQEGAVSVISFLGGEEDGLFDLDVIIS